MSDYRMVCMKCNKMMPDGCVDDFCPKCEGKRIGEKLVEEFKWKLLNAAGPPGINECIQHHKKEWISKNCPYCQLEGAEGKLKDAQNEVKRLQAVERMRSNCEMQIRKLNVEWKGGKY